MAGNGRTRRVASRVMVGALVAVGLVAAGGGSASAATSLSVDQANPACTDSGAGSATQPYCTIVKAATVATAGTTVFVASGTYAGNISVSNSGAAGTPVTLTAAPEATVVVQGGSDGFKVSSKSYVTISGFTVTGTTSYGIYVSGANHVVLANNRVTLSGQPLSGSTKAGIKLSSVTASTISANTTDHNSDAGIAATSNSNGNVFSHNVSYANARGYVRAAAGIDVRGSTGNLLDGNVVHDNEDSGLNIWSGATGTLATNNVAYNNGDHGIDVHNTTSARVIANTLVGNFDSGIEFTTSTYGTTANNVSVDNGYGNRTHGDLRVDSTSRTGISLDDDLVYLGSPGDVIDWAGKAYSSLAAFQAATGQELRGGSADPQFRDRAAADFHLIAGSAAIDSANSGVSGAPATDFDGAARVDDPTTPDTGVGPRTYDDRGAFEFVG